MSVKASSLASQSQETAHLLIKHPWEYPLTKKLNCQSHDHTVWISNLNWGIVMRRFMPIMHLSFYEPCWVLFLQWLLTWAQSRLEPLRFLEYYLSWCLGSAPPSAAFKESLPGPRKNQKTSQKITSKPAKYKNYFYLQRYSISLKELWSFNNNKRFTARWRPWTNTD